MSYKTKVVDRGEEAPADRDPANDPMNCPQCGGITRRGTLSNYGARCFKCYEDYCREPFRQLQPSKYADSIRAKVTR
jgi:hypothetical protein